ncbi:MAG: hypothetical protein QW505_01440 [Thermoplasmata archaeon]
MKRRIPKMPGKSKCNFTFEVDGEIVMMKVDCLASCQGKNMPKDVCWSNLVKAISGSALPDRIMLCGERMMICDRILVSLLRNASLLVRRIGIRLDELRRNTNESDPAEVERLSDLMRALLYDIPQLIRRDFRGENCRARTSTSQKCASGATEFDAAEDILAKKANMSLDPLGSSLSEKVSS